MFYKVISYFGQGHPWWSDFAKDHWVQPLTSFDSIDGILAPDIFHPQTEDDWEHCVLEDFKTSLITDKEYARKIWLNNPGSRLLGVVENSNCDDQVELLGYDVLDEDNHVSLITNWGPHDQDHPFRPFPVSPNRLMPSYDIAENAIRFLRANFASSEHPPGSIWAIFSIGT